MDQLTARGIARDTLSIRVCEALKDLILSGSAPQGTRLDEVSLSRQFNVSRTVIRDAISRLADMGLVVKEPHMMAYVRVFTAEDIKNIFDVRLALELMVIEKAVLDQEAINTLEDLLKRELESAKSGDVAAYISIDRDFHETLASLTDNGVLARMFIQIREQIQVARSLMTTRRPGRMFEAASEHREILDALKRGDRDAALRAMRKHIESAKEETITRVNPVVGA